MIREGKEHGEGGIDNSLKTSYLTPHIKNAARVSSSAGDVAGKTEKQKRREKKEDTKSEATTLEENEDSSLKCLAEDTTRCVLT